MDLALGVFVVLVVRLLVRALLPVPLLVPQLLRVGSYCSATSVLGTVIFQRAYATRGHCRMPPGNGALGRIAATAPGGRLIQSCST